MRLSEAHADISVHLMTLNPGPGHGGMSCTSPSKSTFSMAWHHNRNAKNAQSQAKKTAEELGIGEDEAMRFVCLMDAKANYALRSGRKKWFRLASVDLEN